MLPKHQALGTSQRPVTMRHSMGLFPFPQMRKLSLGQVLSPALSPHRAQALSPSSHAGTLYLAPAAPSWMASVRSSTHPCPARVHSLSSWFSVYSLGHPNYTGWCCSGRGPPPEIAGVKGLGPEPQGVGLNPVSAICEWPHASPHMALRLIFLPCKMGSQHRNDLLKGF